MKEAKAKRILAIDDEPEFLDAIRPVLVGAGYDVVTESDPQAGLSKAIGERFDLIILDVAMPSMDGYQICERLKVERATFNVPVLFVSAKREPADLLKGFFSGAHEYLTKPVRQADLVSKVERLLR